MAEFPVPSPVEILRLSPAAADELLDRLESEVPVADGLAELPGAPSREAIVFGDTHGDWRSAEAAVARFLAAPHERVLVGLGDYIDRAPRDCGAGSAANALYLLALRAAFPDRVWLLVGNHETARRIGVRPHDTPHELDRLWGPNPDRYARFMGLLERGSLAALAPSGAYFAHAGFPDPRPWRDVRAAFLAPSDEDLGAVVWRDCADSGTDRGVGAPFTEADLETFFASLGASVFVRGHDPDLTGRAVYGRRCLTLHTSRLYERFGGVLAARVPLDRSIHSAADLRVEHLETEGRRFAPPA
jgi:hypothetical protein